MLKPPKTWEEARNYYYNTAGKGEPVLHLKYLCAFPVGRNHRQCSRSPGHGTDRLFCKQHAKMVERDTK